MTFSTTRRAGTRQRMLTYYIWVPVCIKIQKCAPKAHIFL